MESTVLPFFEAELSFGQLSVSQYFDVARKTADLLNWQSVSDSTHSLVFHTPGGGDSLGESVSILYKEGCIYFKSTSVNDFVHESDPNEQNLLAFKTTLDKVAAQSRELEMKQNFYNLSVFKTLLPSRQHLVTPLLIYANVIIFVAMVATGMSLITPDVTKVFAWGGDFRSSILQGEWWRLFTSMFLHFGLIHLVMNMYALLYIGSILEPMMGKLRMAVAYLITGLAGSLLSFAMHPFNVGAGASGAIFGLFGVFLALLTTNHIEKSMRVQLLKNMVIFLLYNLSSGMKGGIDNAAHLGGLVSGFLVGRAFYPGIRNWAGLGNQLKLSAIMLTIILLTTLVAIKTLPDEYKIFQADMEKFARMESMAIETVKTPTHFSITEDSATVAQRYVYDIENRGIYYWKENLLLLDEVYKLHLLPSQRDAVTLLRKYCNIRLESYKLIVRKLSENTTEYDTQIKQDTKEADEIVETIKNAFSVTPH